MINLHKIFTSELWVNYERKKKGSLFMKHRVYVLVYSMEEHCSTLSSMTISQVSHTYFRMLVYMPILKIDIISHWTGHFHRDIKNNHTHKNYNLSHVENWYATKYTRCVLTAACPSNDRLGGSGISGFRSFLPGTQNPAAALWMCLSQTEGILHGRPGQTTSTLARTTESVHPYHSMTMKLKHSKLNSAINIIKQLVSSTKWVILKSLLEQFLQKFLGNFPWKDFFPDNPQTFPNLTLKTQLLVNIQPFNNRNT